jgi:hypothetical protein
MTWKNSSWEGRQFEHGIEDLSHQKRKIPFVARYSGWRCHRRMIGWGETIGEGRVRVREALVEMKKTIAEIENLPSTVVKFSI